MSKKEEQIEPQEITLISLAGENGIVDHDKVEKFIQKVQEIQDRTGGVFSCEDLPTKENYLLQGLGFDAKGQKIYICTKQSIVPSKVVSMWCEPMDVTIEEGFIFRKEKRKYRHINVFGQYIGSHADFMKCKDIEKSPCFVRYKEPLDNSPSEEKIEL